MANASNLSNGTWFQALTQAWNDEGFRQALLDDASSAIETRLHAEGQEAAALPRYATEIPADNAFPCIC